MFSEKGKNIVLLVFFLTLMGNGFSQVQPDDEEQKTLQLGLDLLERYFSDQERWHVSEPETGEKVMGLIHFIEKEPIDTIIRDIDSTFGDTIPRYVYRLPENVPDSLEVPGYYPAPRLEEDIDSLWNSLVAEYQQKELSVPLSLVSDIEKKAGTIPSDEGEMLLEKEVIDLPDSLHIPDVIPDSLMQSPDDFKRFLQLDSLRDRFIEQKRIAYNDSVITAYRDSVIEDFRQQQLEMEFRYRKERLTDSVELNNYEVLKEYNEAVVQAVNDSISLILQNLVKYADFIDTTRVYMTNLVGDESSVLLENSRQNYSRFWLKNEQNDSLRLTVKNQDKNTIQFLIDDGVTFSRFTPKRTKDFDFSSLSEDFSGFSGVDEKYQVLTPWRIGGNGSVGFTQTYLENWKKGGQSALSLLMVLKGFANYSSHDGKIKWENSGEIRNGWIRPGGAEAELQKNDDKFEFTSRLGVSAFKKWFYSSEFNYETQFFNGYKYPTSSNPVPISAFMSPARTFFKIGLDYKPNRDFSLFLSPVTAKNVFVRDTSRIDQTKFGVDANKRGFWNAGLNADLRYRKEVTPDITYETKYKMFINYKYPFSKFDINWENQMVMKLSDYINLRMMIHLIYDDDVLFPVYDEAGERTGSKARLQVKEFFTVGFTYSINRQVTRTRRKTLN